MTPPLFDHPPSVPILTRLLQGSLRHNLAKALRLWVILQTLYGDSDIALDLPDTFTYNQWRDQFFTQTRRRPDALKTPLHHQRDTIPPRHDRHCPCAHPLTHWLFHSPLRQSETEWSQDFLRTYAPLTSAELDELLYKDPPSLSSSSQPPQSRRRGLPEGRLFAVTGKELQNYFQFLLDTRWLQAAANQGQSKAFQKVTALPDLQPPASPETTLALDKIAAILPLDVTDWMGDFTHPINDIVRAKAHLEYIIPARLSHHVQSLQKQLKTFWSQDPVPPICISYHSAHHFMDLTDPPLSLIAYPVRIDYFRRATYLYGYGQTPLDRPIQPEQPQWYDFRLDRISALEPLSWDDPQIPTSLCQQFRKQQLPTVTDLDQAQQDVWGFDVQRPAAPLLLRFDPYFHAQYVAQTERASLLSAISPAKVRQLIQNAQSQTNRSQTTPSPDPPFQTEPLSPQQAQILHRILEKHPNSIYCALPHRLGDNNITMRLRAWGPKVEVLLPWSLRDRMAHDIHLLMQLYDPPSLNSPPHAKI